MEQHYPFTLPPLAVEDESGVRLERSHPGQVLTLVEEVRHPPLQAFVQPRHGIVDQRAQVVQDRLSKRGGLCDIGVNLGVICQ